VEAARVDGETAEKINKLMIYLLRKLNRGNEGWMQLARLKGLRKEQQVKAQPGKPKVA